MLIAGLDIETTGLEWAKGHRIIEVAAVLYDLHTGAQKGAFVRRCNPMRPIDAEALGRHKITFESLAAAPVWEVVAPGLSRLLNHPALVAVVAHNGEAFDKPFINHELARVGQPIFDKPMVDTMQQARWATPFGKLPSLGELAFACGVPYDTTRAHQALYDVQIMMACFFHAYRKGFFTLPDLKPAALAA